ncbi:MAG: hypothetical protein RLY43_569 [Bacteroidota bacterium]
MSNKNRTGSYREYLIRLLQNPDEQQGWLSVAVEDYLVDNNVDYLLHSIKTLAEAKYKQISASADLSPVRKMKIIQEIINTTKSMIDDDKIWGELVKKTEGEPYLTAEESEKFLTA